MHSFLILRYSEGKKVAMNVGFYYMANAGGRLLGTVLSGALYQWRGLEACLWASVAFVLAAGFLSRLLPDAKAARGEAACLTRYFGGLAQQESIKSAPATNRRLGREDIDARSRPVCVLFVPPAGYAQHGHRRQLRIRTDN